MVRLLLLRHFDRDLADASQASPLLPVGQQRAAKLAEELAGSSAHLLCSPFRRCLQSVRHLPGELVVDDSFSEYPVEHSLDQALARRHVEELDMTVRDWHWRRGAVPGETLDELEQRCRLGLQTHLMRLADTDGLVVLCSHQTTLQHLSTLLGCPHEFEQMGDSLRLDVHSFV